MAQDQFKRKLTTIFSADVAGYSRLMRENEAATVKTLEQYKQIMSELIRQHRGRVVDSPGDSLLAEFTSVVDAVQCAVATQKELQARNAELPENRRMQFRIGVNLGDVIEEESRIYGDGVNIAARLESLANPGGICISKTAFEKIKIKLPFGYTFLGEQTVKNIAKPVGAYRINLEPMWFKIHEEEIEAIKLSRFVREVFISDSKQARYPEQAHAANLTGIAFSGGGIRSATFNLGVLQGLAKLKLLHIFDYLSTVSGGGYIGSWLSAWLFRSLNCCQSARGYLVRHCKPPRVYCHIDTHLADVTHYCGQSNPSGEKRPLVE